MEEDDARPHRQQDVTANKAAESKKKELEGKQRPLKCVCVLDQVEDLTLRLAAAVLTDCKLHFLMVYRSVYESDESRVGTSGLARAAISDSTRANDSPIQFTCKIRLCGLTRRSERFFFSSSLRSL